MRRVVKEKLGKKAVFPGFIKPALAEQLSRPPKGEGWIHEVKFDGYRVQVHIANDANRPLEKPIEKKDGTKVVFSLSKIWWRISGWDFIIFRWNAHRRRTAVTTSTSDVITSRD